MKGSIGETDSKSNLQCIICTNKRYIENHIQICKFSQSTKKLLVGGMKSTL